MVRPANRNNIRIAVIVDIGHVRSLVVLITLIDQVLLPPPAGAILVFKHEQPHGLHLFQAMLTHHQISFELNLSPNKDIQIAVAIDVLGCAASADRHSFCINGVNIPAFRRSTVPHDRRRLIALGEDEIVFAIAVHIQNQAGRLLAPGSGGDGIAPFLLADFHFSHRRAERPLAIGFRQRYHPGLPVKLLGIRNLHRSNRRRALPQGNRLGQQS
jgi:hypothetical protein